MNWGTKLMIGMALFMSFIVILVLRMVFSTPDALIDNNYYEKGQTYNTEYNAKQVAVKDSVVPEIEINESGLDFTFTEPAQYKLVCKRPSDAEMDLEFKGKLEPDLRLHIPRSKLEKGSWHLRLEYTIADKAYLVVREIVMP